MDFVELAVVHEGWGGHDAVPRVDANLQKQHLKDSTSSSKVMSIVAAVRIMSHFAFAKLRCKKSTVKNALNITF